MVNARIKSEDERRRALAVNPFKIAADTHPPAVIPPADSKLAMDSGTFSENAGWAAAAFGSAAREGVAFLGYAVLAELSQRPEYRAAVEIIAMHMTRRWIKFKVVGDEDSDEKPKPKADLDTPPGAKPKKKPKKSAKDKKKAVKIRKIEAFLKKIGAQAAFRRIAEHDGFFGRAHLYLNTDDGDKPDELMTDIGSGTDEASIAKVNPDHPLKALKAIEAVFVYPTDYNASDPLHDDWYKPRTWMVMGKRVHRSRLLPFVGREVSDLLKPAYSFGGLPLTQMGMPYVDNWLRTRQSVADIISAFSVMVLKTNLAMALNTNQGDPFFDRLDFFNLVRNNRGVFAVDKEDEDFDNVSAPLGTLDSLQAQTQEHMAAVWGIPIVELLGIQPAGLNASSEGEMKTFRARIEAQQERLFRPGLTTVVAFAQLSLFGEVDEEIDFDFAPLEPLNDKERAEVQDILARVDETLVSAQILNPEEARERLAGDPDSPYYGIDVDDIPEIPDPGLIDASGGVPPKLGGGGSASAEEKPVKKAPVAGKVKEAA
jgi:phage-related protein (TIGR01555 family)